ncbi:hypothetical protein QJQ45_023767 [Haematococcus lacustris]|nr:hypothetical protein QJQ45_023767 [Haematococcus lacustris]
MESSSMLLIPVQGKAGAEVVGRKGREFLEQQGAGSGSSAPSPSPPPTTPHAAELAAKLAQRNAAVAASEAAEAEAAAAARRRAALQIKAGGTPSGELAARLAQRAAAVAGAGAAAGDSSPATPLPAPSPTGEQQGPSTPLTGGGGWQAGVRQPVFGGPAAEWGAAGRQGSGLKGVAAAAGGSPASPNLPFAFPSLPEAHKTPSKTTAQQPAGDSGSGEAAEQQ